MWFSFFWSSLVSTSVMGPIINGLFNKLCLFHRINDARVVLSPTNWRVTQFPNWIEKFNGRVNRFCHFHDRLSCLLSLFDKIVPYKVHSYRKRKQQRQQQRKQQFSTRFFNICIWIATSVYRCFFCSMATRHQIHNLELGKSFYGSVLLNAISTEISVKSLSFISFRASM